jgi:hypothetical protein
MGSIPHSPHSSSIGRPLRASSYQRQEVAACAGAQNSGDDGCPARIRTSANWSRASRAAVTPPGNRFRTAGNATPGPASDKARGSLPSLLRCGPIARGAPQPRVYAASFFGPREIAQPAGSCYTRKSQKSGAARSHRGAPQVRSGAKSNRALTLRWRALACIIRKASRY